MTGPTAEVLSGYGAEPRRRTDSGSLEDEPWDQRRPKNRGSPSVSREEEELQFQRRMIAMNTKANPGRGSGGGRRGLVSPDGPAGDEELLDDGDLPSLATSHAPAAAARAADADGADATDTTPAGELLLGGRTTQPLKSPSASNSTGRKKAERRKFWGQMEGADSEQPGTTNKEEDGPHDEMAARRRRRRRTAQPKGGEDDDTDYDSVPTDIESQMTEEEVEEEYETSFCGQTLNAIGDICGGNLNNLTNEEAAAIKGDGTARSPQSRSPRSHRSPNSSVASPLSPRFDPTMQQEHTAIEVEFVEPVASKKSSKKQLGESTSSTTKHQEGEGTRTPEVMSDTPSDVSSKKAAYLNAIAKRAKENFRRKKGKDIPSEAFVDATIQTSRATPSSLSGSDKGAVVPESAPEQKLSSSDGGSFDEDDYNRFSPAEKRKFVKLINGGLSAGEATHQVINERKLAAVEQEGKSAPKGAARLAFWKRTQQQQQGPALKTSGSGSQVDSDADEPDGGAPQNKSADLPDDEKSSGIDPAIRNLDEGGGEFPFQKSGVNYYDAVRREVEVEDDSDEASRAKSMSRSEAGKGPRLFGKTRGFSALDDSSTEDHSKKSDPRDKMPTAVSPTEDQDQSKSVPPSQQAAPVMAAPVTASPQNEMSAAVKSSRQAGHVRGASSSDDEWSSPSAVESLLRLPIRKSLTGTAGYQKVGSEANLPTPPPQAKQENEAALQTESDALLTASPPPPESREAVVDVDLSGKKSMDEYFQSTVNDAHSGNYHINDNMSVFTAGTNITGTTNYTQSSRVRRPGAAKTRLAQQKKIEHEMEKKQQGWQETIQAVAKSTNRVWDPKKGWVDYEEPDMDTVTKATPKDKGKIHLDLDRSVLSHKEEDTGRSPYASGASSVSVPFPEEWEKERNEMIGASDAPLAVNQSATQYSVDRDMPEIRTSQHSSDRDMSGTREERKEMIDDSDAPFAAQNESAMQYSAERGTSRRREEKKLRGLEGDDPSLTGYSSLGGASASVDGVRSKGWIESMRAVSAVLADQGKSWDPEHGWMIKNEDGQLVPDPVIGRLDGSSESRALPIESTRALPTEPKVRTVGSLEIANEPRSLARVPPILTEASPSYLTEEELDNDSEPMMMGTRSDEFEKPLSPIVSVVKQKVGQEDINLFSEEGRRKNRNSGYASGDADSPKRVDATAETPRSNVSVISRDHSAASSRRNRSVGPIDVDEVDEAWDSEGEDLDGRRSLAKANESVSRSVVSGSETGANESTNRSMVSGGSSGSRIPKLKMSKRDTTPVHVRRAPAANVDRSKETSGERYTSPVQKSGNASAERRKTPRGRRAIPTPADTEGEDRYHSDASSRTPPASSEPDAAAPVSPSVKERLQEWETRIETSNSYDTPEKFVEPKRSTPKATEHTGAAGWKTFLGKKVSAESAAAAAAGTSRSPSGVGEETKEPEGHYTFARNTETIGGKPQKDRTHRDDYAHADDDSLFDFKNRSAKSDRAKRNHPDDLNISDISPIRAKDEQSDTDMDDDPVSEAYGPTEEERQPSSIMKRLTECAAPMMPNRMSPNSGASRFLPTTLCGRPDVDEPDESIASSSAQSTTSPSGDVKRSGSFGDEKPKSRSSPKKRQTDNLPVSSSSVVSEDFGAKTAYLEALAMRTAVSKPKRSSSARRDRSSASSVTSGSTVQSSARWKEFLERKKATGASPKGSQSDVSKAAERYASEKVEEIMSKMSSSSRARSVARSRDVHKEHDMIGEDGAGQASSKSSSVQAAEDLAAARVEAMMAALSTAQMEEGEI